MTAVILSPAQANVTPRSFIVSELEKLSDDALVELVSLAELAGNDPLLDAASSAVLARIDAGSQVDDDDSDDEDAGRRICID